ncbi:alcohol dehydrogenase family protein [Sphingomonas sp.]|uniref:alcohol dehydrogenase family protein n=1 Tax=Sphingomonas sp. TaxID=28214 RepID=UPI00286C9BD0|nr:alcohol dehydrogenase family protein [Sphingomonas sp.]
MSAIAILPERMRAVLLTGNGGFDKLDYRDDVPVPRPGPGEVLIRVAAAGVNNTDINTRAAWYSKSVASATDAGGAVGFVEARSEDSGWTGAVPHFPRIQGADACGRIVAVGEGVPASRIGSRVIVEPVFRAEGAPIDSAIYFGSERDGAFAEFTVTPSRHAHAVDCEWSDGELASIPCAYSAAENMLTRAGLVEGETVLITGASGGVGSAAVQLAKRRGARVIAVVGADKAGAIRAIGAQQTINRSDDLLTELEPESVDVVIDVVGGSQFDGLLQLLKRGGRYAVAGAIAGPIVSLDLRTLYLKDLRLLGCTVIEPSVFPNLVSYIERGEIRPLVAATYPLADIVVAQTAFLAKTHIGKIVLLC